MRCILSIVLFSLLCTSFLAQNRNGIFTGEKTDQEAYSEGQTASDRVLIVPFEPKMYMSGIDKDISMKTGMTFQQIRNNMRFGLCNELLSQLHGQMKTTSLMHLDTGGIEEELRYIYASIGYKYKEMPTEQMVPVKEIEPGEDAKTIDKAKYKLNTLVNNVKDKVNTIGETEEEEPVRSAGVVNGEVVTSYDDSERYMATSIHNPNLLNQLNMKFGATKFMFINQLDIERAAKPTQRGLATDSYQRKIKVHYTIFNLDGTEFSSGASISYFPSRVNDMNIIIKNHFAAISKHISSKLSEPEANHSGEREKSKDTRSEIEKY